MIESDGDNNKLLVSIRNVDDLGEWRMSRRRKKEEEEVKKVMEWLDLDVMMETFEKEGGGGDDEEE